ncbi:MAG: ThiF family adenylyltransferase [Candidatus Saccharimonadales bacterium]
MKKPIILQPKSFDLNSLQLIKRNKIWKIVDIYESQLRELYDIEHPEKAGLPYEAFAEQKKAGDLEGAWVYYPWSGVLLHLVSQEDLYLLRTNRNKNLITDKEQMKLFEATVAIAGMSVGSSIAMACIHSGIGKRINIADFDELETPNLNRLSEKVINIGEKKSDLTARKIYELDPYIKVKDFGMLNKKNVGLFLGTPRVSVVIDEVDDFKMKILLRLEAKKYKVPVLMFTSLGDNILVDVERYDLDPNTEPFNGALGASYQVILAKDSLSADDLKQLAVRVVGIEHVPTRALHSLTEIGKTLAGRPQLYSTIAVDGGLAAYLVRQLILGETINSGRYFIKFSSLFGLSNDGFD